MTSRSRRRRDDVVRRRRGRRERLDRRDGHLVQGSPLGAGWVIDPGPRQGAVLPRRVAQLRRLRRGPEVRLRHDLPGRRGQWKVEKIAYNAPGCAGLVPRHDVRQRRPDLNNHAALPVTVPRAACSCRQPLQPAAVAPARPPRGPDDPQGPAVPTAVVERRVRPREDVAVHGVLTNAARQASSAQVRGRRRR